MKLIVGVMEARNIPAMDINGFSDPYVKLQLGKQRYKTKVVKKTLNPIWGEEFSFKVEDLNEELLISVLDEDKYFNDDFVGHLKVPVSQVFDAHNKSLGTAWYALHPKNKKLKNKDCGEILLSIYFSLNNLNFNGDPAPTFRKHEDMASNDLSRSFSGSSNSSSPPRQDDNMSSKEEKSSAQKSLAGRITQMFNRNVDTASTTSSRGTDLTEIPEIWSADIVDNKSDDESSSFEEAVEALCSRDQGSEVPSNLPGGVLLDQLYVIAPKELNSLLFSPDSNFPRSVAELQGSTDLQFGPWKFENGGESLQRIYSYIRAPTKLIKAVKATEEHTYIKADGKTFAVLSVVSTPDVMYGSTFKTEVLYCITPGPELPSGEQSSHLVISWRTNFLQSTMMKGIIENGTRQGLRESFEHFTTLLEQTIKPVDPKDLGLNKEQLLGSLQAEPQSDWKLAVQYLANFTIASTVLMSLYVIVHICLVGPSTIQGLEFVGLDLPDSIGELIVCAVLVLQGERVLQLISRYVHARAQKGSDHGVKAQGDGWLLTVALIEGSNLAAVDSSGFCDPYVVFTCNGKTRTSSIKYQKSAPQWNEIFEFDAMKEPPSVLDVEVFDFDGPFDEPTSLGRAEVNFVRSNISDLADVWVPLQGKLAQACQSKLHLRIFVENTRGGNVVAEYLKKMEKEVGKKINVRSPQTNSTFQKLFGLPPEEFLINDFTCHLKRRMPLQGRLFLSPRIIGFHANLFGHRTKFFFLWEDIEDIQVFPPTLASMGSPVIVVTLRPGRGMDARHGAKTQDEEGRLKFHFQSFVSFNIAHRTIMALWKARALSPEQKVQIAEEESESKGLQSDESGSFLVLEDVSMSEVYSRSLPIPIGFVMDLFSGGELEYKAMKRAGGLNYSCTPWESEKPDVYERQVYYRFDKHVSGYRGEVTSTQQKSLLPDKNGWLIEEVMTLHGVPLGDHFNLHLRYHIEDLHSRAKGCQVRVFFGIAWLKSTKHEKRIANNIFSNLEGRLKVIFGVVEKEYTSR
ncbi:C2 and GRAM domain-containing protein [Hibiscus syriacus]|uniref:C2 and GRAM domain-containing protein n=1 Tax=Hibiscus syriacus TaxID=106335 RepID=A0A6A2Z3B7_HIBSY|nr:C2 and GRAM domain-containing protein At1g03370-like [Hibiscus syriacus]KAE8686358.1 C2 and GRAM domain-containing protein [Hibiscus syriacus]